MWAVFFTFYLSDDEGEDDDDEDIVWKLSRLRGHMLTTCGLQTCFCTSLSLKCKPLLIVHLM